MGHYLSNYVGDFIGRFDGPLHFRLIVQPLVACLLAIKHGAEDAREARPAYGWVVLTDGAHRRYLLEEGWKDISKVFILAYALDVIYQLVEWHRIKPLQALLTAILLAAVPYLLLRGPVNRLLSLRHSHVKHV